MDERMKADKGDSERAIDDTDGPAGGGRADSRRPEGDGAVGESEPVEVADGGHAAAAEGEPVGEAGEPVDAGTAELESLQAELESLNERHLRLAAEFDNYRKRIGRERDELRVRAQAELAKGLLEVLDDVQRITEYEAEAASVDALLEGARLVEKKFRHVLAAAGLEPVQAEGEFFNPNTMEALMTVPAEHPEEDDVVADVFQKGYRFGDLLIRPARVRVKKYERDE